LEGLPSGSFAFWLVRVLTLVLVVGALASVLVFCLGLVLTWRDSRKEKQRGFEVKLTPSTTPGLIEEKEE